MTKSNYKKDKPFKAQNTNLNFNKAKNFKNIISRSYKLVNPSSPKWLRITCLSEPISASQDILNRLQDLLYLNTGRQVRLSAFNPSINKDILEFYVSLTKPDIDLVMSKYYKIEQYRLKCYKHDDLHMPMVIPLDWIENIKLALSRRFKKNPETNETELDLSNFSGDMIFQERNLILDLYHAKLSESVLNVLKGELNDLTKLNLSNNKLINIYKFRNFIKDAQVKKLDLSNNRISNIKYLDCLENSAIVELDLSENDGKSMTFSELRKGIGKYLPKLQLLNGKVAAIEIQIAGVSQKSTKKLPETVWSPKEGDAYNFVVNYVTSFDSKTRDKLCDFYSTDSVLSLATPSESHYFYTSNNSNYNTMKRRDERDIIRHVKKGKAHIIGTFANFPTTKHIIDTLNVDIVCQTNSFMILNISGVFIELASAKLNVYQTREFSRTMMIVVGGVIIQDFIHLMSNSTKLNHKFKPVIDDIKSQVEFFKSHKALDTFTLEQVEVVRQFKLFSRLNVPTCIEFLFKFQGLENAKQEFTKIQAQNQIPNSYFIDD